ncbi:hypothetical protein MMPV_000084 [Pyropia vietnamensis]
MEVSRAVRPPPRSTDHLSHVPVVVTGDGIAVERGFLRGHGTALTPAGAAAGGGAAAAVGRGLSAAGSNPADGHALRATLTGVVKRVNKLVAVAPLRSRYSPEVGDVVVARVLDIAAKRWRCDVAGRQTASLALSAVNLPGGVQRRRTAADERNMRDLYSEGDLLSAEVQELRHDGGIALHTRSLKYGKLTGGLLVVVAPALVKRSKKHFHLLGAGVWVILGNNGYIWLSPTDPAGGRGATRDAMDEDADGPSAADAGADTDDAAAGVTEVEMGSEMRLTLARVRNAIAALDQQFVAIHAATIMDVVDAAEAAGVDVADMSRPSVVEQITASARERRDVA